MHRRISQLLGELRQLITRPLENTTAAATTPIRVHSCLLKLVWLPLSLAATLTALPSISEIPFLDSWLRLLRGASNKGTLRAFRNADRFTTFKIFRRPAAL